LENTKSEGLLETSFDQRVVMRRASIEDLKKRVPLAVLKSLAETNAAPVPLVDQLDLSSPNKNLLVWSVSGFDDHSCNALSQSNPRIKAFVLEFASESTHGHEDLRRRVRNETSQPIIHNELVLDEYQIHEARALGADAVILHAAIVDHAEIQYFTEICRDYGMAALILIANKADLDKVMATDIELLIFDGLPGLSALAAFNGAKIGSTPLPLEKRRGFVRAQSIPATDAINELIIPMVGFIVPGSAFQG